MAWTIDKPSLHHSTKLYTGTGASLANTGVGFQPDLTWIKGRSNVSYHRLTDAVRGVTKEIYSNAADIEGTNANGLTAFGTDGFTVGNHGDYNSNGWTFAAWNWLANGAGSSNTDGTITSTVSANTTAGFSIVKYTGNLTASSTVGHGLSTAPKMILVKNLDAAQGWTVYHSSLGIDQRLVLNSANGTGTCAACFQSTRPTSTVFTVGADADTNGSTNGMIAYCFADVKGYSKIGSYTGNGNADGTFIYTGLKPAFVMIKSTALNSWEILDNKRNPSNVVGKSIFPDGSGAEYDYTNRIDILSNGFKARTTSDGVNGSGINYIYMAFAENPFVTSTGVPATAR